MIIGKEMLIKTDYIKTPYHHDLAPKLKRIFKNTNSKLAFYNSKTNNNFYRNTKDKIDKMNKSNVIYKVECQCGDSYVGQTKQKLKNRINQHRNDISKGETLTGLSKHVADTQHKIKWDSVKVVQSESNWQRRSFLEMYHVVKNENSLNIQSDYKNFNNTYQRIINKI